MDECDTDHLLNDVTQRPLNISVDGLWRVVGGLMVMIVRITDSLLNYWRRNIRRSNAVSLLNIPVRWYSQGQCNDILKLDLKQTAIMIVDSDCGPGNPCVEEGIVPALATY